jgi:hypothetical protein
LYSKDFSGLSGKGEGSTKPKTIGGILTLAQQEQMQKGEQKSPA